MLEDSHAFLKNAVKAGEMLLYSGACGVFKIGPLMVKSGDLESVVWAPHVAPPLSCVTWSK